MAAFVLTDAFVSINAQTWSTYVTEVELDVQVEDKETTAMGATYKSRIGGLKEGSIKLKLNQDVAAGLLDALAFPLLGTVVAFEIRPTSAAVGTSNPKFTGSALVTEWKPVSGSVGDLATVDVTFPTTGAVVRATS